MNEEALAHWGLSRQKQTIIAYVNVDHLIVNLLAPEF